MVERSFVTRRSACYQSLRGYIEQLVPNWRHRVETPFKECHVPRRTTGSSSDCRSTHGSPDALKLIRMVARSRFSHSLTHLMMSYVTFPAPQKSEIQSGVMDNRRNMSSETFPAPTKHETQAAVVVECSLSPRISCTTSAHESRHYLLREKKTPSVILHNATIRHG